MKGIGLTNIFKKHPSQIVAAAPCFGEHNREVLESFGYTKEEIDAMYDKGDLVTWTPADTARIQKLRRVELLLGSGKSGKTYWSGISTEKRQIRN